MNKDLTDQQKKNLIKAGYKLDKNGDLVIEERGFFSNGFGGSTKKTTKKSSAKTAAKKK